MRCRQNAHNETWQNVIHGSRRWRQKKGNSVPFGKAGGIAIPVLYETRYNFPERIRKTGKVKELKRV